MSEEIEFRDVVGFDGYRVSNTGIVQSCWKMYSEGYGKWNCRSIKVDRWKTLKQDVDDRGRARVTMRMENRKYRKKFVSVLILESFVGPAPDKHRACHNDGNASNNILSNLRWDTDSANQLDRIKHGTDMVGIKHPLSKLTEEQVLQIRIRLANGESAKNVAAEFKVTPQNLQFIAEHSTWKHIGGPVTEKIKWQ